MKTELIFEIKEKNFFGDTLYIRLCPIMDEEGTNEDFFGQEPEGEFWFNTQNFEAVEHMEVGDHFVLSLTEMLEVSDDQIEEEQELEEEGCECDEDEECELCEEE